MEVIRRELIKDEYGWQGGGAAVAAAAGLFAGDVE